MSIYEKYNDDQLEELFSNYLIDSWSYSKVSTFSRNEKAFEMQYIYRNISKYSSANVAGSAYHEGLKIYFENLKDGVKLDIVDIEKIAFDYISEYPANNWKIQKTTPTIDECVIKSNKTASSLIKNFFTEISVYTSELKEIICVEKYINTWLTINGVDIPLPCHMQLDEVIRLNNGKVVIIDHKSKASFSDEKELMFTIGKQAITYAKGFEKEFNIKVDEVWFIENKHSKNRDGSPQLKPLRIELGDDIRKLYESMLYEPLRRVMSAVSDPDYVYVINDNDNFIDKAEIYDFWAKTMVAEIDDFNILDSKKPIIEKRLKKIRNAEIASINPNIISTFRKNASEFITYNFTNKNMTKSEKIEHILRTFGIVVSVAHKFCGYSSDTFLLEVGVGSKISNITARKMDIANVLDVSNVRIGKDLLVYEDKSYVFIEIIKKRDKTLNFDAKYLEGVKIPIGIDNFDKTIVWDISNQSTPHMLICGATGSGKSVSITSTIEYAKLAGVTDIVLLDPKYEFSDYSGDVEVIQDIAEIENEMRLLVDEMNNRVKSGLSSYKLVIFDEFADAVANSKKGNELKVYSQEYCGSYANGLPKFKRVHADTLKSLEENLKALLQKGRSSGYRIISATQRASVKVITGDAKVNFPVQVCFRVPKAIDSKVVIDEEGAESLAGAGDGLIRSPEYMDVVRFQGFYKSK